ncbi:hypothetical protein JCM9803A_02240 [Rhodococcus erythropolis]
MVFSLVHDEAAGTEEVSSGFKGSVPVLRLSASGRSKRHFWGGTRGKEPNTDNLYSERRPRVIPPVRALSEIGSSTPKWALSP